MNETKEEETESINNLVTNACVDAKSAIHELTECDFETRQKIVFDYADDLIAKTDQILSTNEIDLNNSSSKLTASFIDRLKLNKESIKGISDGLREIAKQKDPLNQTLSSHIGISGLKVSKVTQSIGLLGVIFESRPNVAADVAAIAIISGNAAILRSGSEATHTVNALIDILHNVLKANSISEKIIQCIPTQDYQAIDIMVSLRGIVDLIVPRGGKKLVSRIIEHSKVPILAHSMGLCHTYIEKSANIKKAISVAVNAKMRRTSICGATETILIDQEIAEQALPMLYKELAALNCESFLCERGLKLIPSAKAASEIDWQTEYNDAKVSIKIVENIDEAINHILTYSSQHTDAIMTESKPEFLKFARKLKSSLVMLNASTQYADGYQLGFGGEIGISTQTMPPRGPVGPSELVSWKYLVEGDYSTRS